MKKLSPFLLVAALVLLMPSNTDSQTRMAFAVSSDAGVTTITIRLPDATWADVMQAHMDISEWQGDPEEYVLGTISNYILNDFNGILAAANARALTDGAPSETVD